MGPQQLNQLEYTGVVLREGKNPHLESFSASVKGARTIGVVTLPGGFGYDTDRE